MSEAVRPARPDDAEGLARLRYAFRAAEDPAVEAKTEFLERCEPWMRRRLEASEDRWRCWVAEPDGGLRGHAWLHLFPKIPNPADEAEAHAYLTNMYVQPEYRGLGLGTALLDAVLTWCRGRELDSVILWPTEDSRPLYRRAGFAPTDGLFELDPDESAR